MTDETRIRTLQIALIFFGVFCIVGVYTMMQVWPSGWVWTPSQHEYEQMLMGIYATLGVFLIIAAKAPLQNRNLIRFTIWSSIVHGVIMLIQVLIAKTEWDHLLGDIPALFLMAGVLWILMPKTTQITSAQ
jgi:hypothetical protein